MSKPYFLDTSLPLRVKKYIEENKYIDIEDMTEYLIQNYKDFGNKKKKPFMKSVEKAYQWELKNKRSNSSENSTSDVTKMESENMFTLDREGSPDIIEISTNNESKKPKTKVKDNSFSIDNLYKNSTATNGFTESKTLQIKKETPQSVKNSKRKRTINDSDLIQTPLSKTRKSTVKSITPMCTFANFLGEEYLPKSIISLYKYLRGDQSEDLPRVALISGPKGSGKSMLIKCLAGDLNVPLYEVSASSLSGGVGIDVEGLLTEIMMDAIVNAPCILHIGNLDNLSSKEFGTVKKSESKIIEQIKKLIEEITTIHSNKQVLLVAESRARMIDPELLYLLPFEIKMPVLCKEAKIELLKEFFSKKGSISSDVNLDNIAERATSFVAGDLEILATKAAFCARFRNNSEVHDTKFSELEKHKYFEEINKKLEIKREDILSAMCTINPILKQEGFPRPSIVKWDDVQGLEDIKKMVMRKIIGPIKDKEYFGSIGIDKPNGMLLYGPPGCGKTLLAEAIANAVGINLLSVKGPELLQMYQGESERQVREVFRRAESVAPCIIFFDEFDSLCPKRTGNADSGSRHSIVNTLLVEMNGFGEKHEVYVIAATNRPEFIDPAVLRPGRIGTMLFVGLPDVKGRIDIFESCAKKKKIVMDSDVNFEEIASWCENFSGADCSEVFKAAVEEAGMEGYSAYKEGKLKSEELRVSKRHFEIALTIARQSVSPEARKDYLNMKTKFESSLRKQ